MRKRFHELIQAHSLLSQLLATPSDDTTLMSKFQQVQDELTSVMQEREMIIQKHQKHQEQLEQLAEMLIQEHKVNDD